MKFHSWSKSFDCILICTYFCFEGENRRTFFRSSVSFRLAFFSSSSPSSLPSLFAIAIYSFLICRSDCFPFVKDYLIRFIFLCLWRSFRFVSMNIEMLEWDFCFGINLVVIDIRSLPRRSCRCVCVCLYEWNNYSGWEKRNEVRNREKWTRNERFISKKIHLGGQEQKRTT